MRLEGMKLKIKKPRWLHSLNELVRDHLTETDQEAKCFMCGLRIGFYIGALLTPLIIGTASLVIYFLVP
jgi:hypothetical protein